MKFKEIKHLIYDDLILIIGKEKLFDVSISELNTKYDNFEVIGIRSDYLNYISYVVISLKEPLFKGNSIANINTNNKSFIDSYQAKD